ncbi:MAG: glycosyltransferase family 39 protein [Sedimentisphaerales bacterium]|nr:glycosyltransferase family 39 protein [Sedimentisphaerales bacterium]
MKRLQNNISTIIFWAVAIFLTLWSLGNKGLWGPEDRWAEVAWEMMLTGDYFHPSMNGEPYFDKPLLSYWLIVAVAEITGRLDEAVVRIPSALAGLVALWATVSLGRKLWSDKAAKGAGWMLLCSYGFLFWARTGEADMENMAAIILAVAWYWSRREKPCFFSYLVFYFICFIGAQTKGLAAVAIPIIVVFPDLLREKRWKSYFSVSHGFALVLGISLYLAPFIYAEMTRSGYTISGLSMIFRENIERYFQPFDHKEPFTIYFYSVPQLLFPWIPLFAAGLWKAAISMKKLEWPRKWLTISTVLIFLFFALSGSRRSYYILPILPFCALLAAGYLDMEKEEKWKQLVLKIQTGVIIAILIADMLSPALAPRLKNGMEFIFTGEFIFSTFLLGFLALGVLIMSFLYPRPLLYLTGSEKSLGAPILMSVILIGGFFVWQHRILDQYRSMKSFSLEVRAEVEKDTSCQIAFYNKIPIKMLFYLGLPEPAPKLTDEESLGSYLYSEGEKKILVVHSKYYAELANLFSKESLTHLVIKEKIYPWEQTPKKYEAWIVDSGGK